MTPSRQKRVPSPPLSVAGSSQFTTTPQQKLNVVARLALEGKAKQGDDGATVRMYLKLSIPMDSVSPGSTVPLFPEENLKLLSAQVHPLDIHSSPYSFSSASFPNLNSAARALHLLPLSQKSYLSVFGLPTPSTTAHSSRTSPTSSSNAPPLDEKYTGHVIVSGYNIAYILPKEFPPRFSGGDSALRIPAQKRRPSVSERNSMHFMAALELWIPYVLRPPKAPFLIAIPVPRCLSNSIKLRIYPPVTAGTSSSLASLSSTDEDPGAWELASEPYVTRNISRNGSSADMADDESSDSSTYADGCSGGILVQGTFPSTERLRIRWAQPTKNMPNSDGRRRVGVKEAQGDMTATVLGRARDPSSGREGILMRLDYKGTCKGVWFPGVATMLGMDVALEVKGADVVWPSREDTKWNITGGTGFTGFDVGPPPTPASRQPSLELSTRMSTSSMLYTPPVATPSECSSTSSLLRAPLPNDHLPDYTFEGSPTSLTPSVTLSSISSLPLVSEARSRASSDAAPSCRSPAIPITIHINMNDITSPAKNVFTFSITGVVLIVPRPRPHVMDGHGLDTDFDPHPVVLPRFCVLAADSETVSTIIRNEGEGVTVEVYYISGDLQDAQTRKTVLQHNGINRCGNDGARIALRPISRAVISHQAGDQIISNVRLTPRHSPINGDKTTLGSIPLTKVRGKLTRRKVDGPLMIPSVNITVTPFLPDGPIFPYAHAVRVRTHVPPDPGSDWLEFGLAQVSPPPLAAEGRQFEVEMLGVSVDGVPAHFSIAALAEQERKPLTDLVPYLDENRWIAWVKIHKGDQGGLVIVDYVVRQVESPKPAKRRPRGDSNFEILIPTFALRVCRLEVTVETHLEMATLESNFAHYQKTQDGYRLMHYSLEQFFTPTLSLILGGGDPYIRTGWQFLKKLALLFFWISPIALVSTIFINLDAEIKHMRQSLDRLNVIYDHDHDKIPTVSTETIFMTTTIFSPTPSSKIESGIVNTPTIASFTSNPSILTLASTPSTSSSHTYDGSQIETVTIIIPTPSSSPIFNDNSLVPMPGLLFEWSRFRTDLPPVAQKTFDVVVDGLGVVWQMFRKVYHYPLDPP